MKGDRESIFIWLMRPYIQLYHILNLGNRGLMGFKQPGLLNRGNFRQTRRFGVSVGVKVEKRGLCQRFASKVPQKDMLKSVRCIGDDTLVGVILRARLPIDSRLTTSVVGTTLRVDVPGTALCSAQAIHVQIKWLFKKKKQRNYLQVQFILNIPHFPSS